MAGKDYYKILGIDKNATKDEIKKSFRKKAHEVHPDKNNGDDTKFKEINEAYQVLSNEKKRAQYDQFGSNFDQPGAGGGYGGFSGGFNAQGFDFNDLGDIMGDMFGFGGRRSSQRHSYGPTRGGDIEVEMNITFEEAAFGAVKEVKLRRQVVCSHCKGNKAEPGTKINTCSTCKGTGSIKKIQRTFIGNIQTNSVCHDCNGEGKKPEKVCKKCKGHGKEEIVDNISIKILSGIDNNEVVKFSGKGQAGSNGGGYGDLYVVFKVQPHKIFKRNSYDIYSIIEIPFTVATLGGEVTVKSLDTDVVLKIPAGTQYGHTFKLKEKGINKLKSSGKGDHIVEVRIVVPEKLNKKQKEILEEFAKERKETNSNKGFWKNVL